MKNPYIELSIYGEKIYRVFLDLLRKELERREVIDLTSIQAFILLNIKGKVVTIGEILSKGYYAGSNVSYNLKKMISSGYLTNEHPINDKRSSNIKLTEKAISLCDDLDIMLEKKTLRLSKLNEIEKSTKYLKRIVGSIKDTVRRY